MAVFCYKVNFLSSNATVPLRELKSEIKLSHNNLPCSTRKQFALPVMGYLPKHWTETIEPTLLRR